MLGMQVQTIFRVPQTCSRPTVSRNLTKKTELSFHQETTRASFTMTAISPYSESTHQPGTSIFPSMYTMYILKPATLLLFSHGN